MSRSAACLAALVAAAASACAVRDDRGDAPALPEPHFEFLGDAPADEPLPQPPQLPYVLAADEDVVSELRSLLAGGGRGYRIVGREPDLGIYTNYGVMGYVLSDATTYGRSLPAPAGGVRSGELLLDLTCMPIYGPTSFQVRFDLVARTSVAAVGTHTLFVQAEAAGEFRTTDDLVRETRRAFGAARARAVKVLVRRLLSDSLTLDAARAAAGAGTASAPAAPPRPALPAPAPTRGRTFVLAVGIDDYADPAITDLASAEGDARDASAFYALHRRSPAGPERVVTLLGAAATRAAVLAAVREHLGQATDEADAAVLFFAGHGFTDANDAYLATADTSLARLPETSIPLAVLRTYWERLGARTKLVLVDACHSGALAGLRGVGGIARPAADPAATRPLGDGTVVVAASAPEQLSAEHPASGRGVFTTALLDGLRGDADQDGDRIVTLAELRAFLEAEVPRRARIAGGRQTPVVVAPAGADAGALTR